MRCLTDFVEDRSGAAAIEYSLIAALVSIAAIGAMGAVGNSLESTFNEVSSELDDASSS